MKTSQDANNLWSNRPQYEPAVSPQVPFAPTLCCPSLSLALQITQVIWQSTSLQVLNLSLKKKNNKKRRTKHLYILWDFSYFPLVLLGSAPFFSFFSPESPTKLGAPRHKGCSSPSLSSFSCHGSMPYWYWSPQGLYTLLSGSKGAAIIPI